MENSHKKAMMAALANRKGKGLDMSVLQPADAHGVSHGGSQGKGPDGPLPPQAQAALDNRNDDGLAPVIHDMASKEGDNYRGVKSPTQEGHPGGDLHKLAAPNHANLAQEVQTHHEMPKNQVSEHGALTDGMSDYDKEQLMSKPPQSLGERARHAILSKKGK